MITIYGKSACVYCKAATVLLDKHGIAYEYKSIDDPTVYEEFRSFYPTAKTVPQITDSDGFSIGGFAELQEYVKSNRGRLLQG